mmetsp:Transcript_17331/g.23803  ORF Transcript_17331/g.23803 Transcript_17331/m.23803 type:complete len:205 (-) Transcript_17331:633-1247(-)
MEASPSFTTVGSCSCSCSSCIALAMRSLADPLLPFLLPPEPSMRLSSSGSFTMDTPTCAALRAPTSLVPSPHMRVTRPARFNASRMASFCAGVTLANTDSSGASERSSRSKLCPQREQCFSSSARAGPVAHRLCSLARIARALGSQALSAGCGRALSPSTSPLRHSTPPSLARGCRISTGGPEGDGVLGAAFTMPSLRATSAAV